MAEQVESQVPALARERLPYHPLVKDRFGVDRAGWRALVDAIFPAARSTEAVVLALSYCKARGLDPFKRVVHIVPMYNSQLGKEVETVWPGIGELRTTAHRTGGFAGCDEAVFGPDQTVEFHDRTRKGAELSATVTFPEWCQMTVYRMVGGQRVAFAGPRVYWLETYSGAQGTKVPNARWQRSPRQMIEKCAEAAATRRAFPEECSDNTAEEMEGKVAEGPGVASAIDITEEPKQSRSESLAQRVAANAMPESTAPAETVDESTGEVIAVDMPPREAAEAQSVAKRAESKPRPQAQSKPAERKPAPQREQLNTPEEEAELNDLFG